MTRINSTARRQARDAAQLAGGYLPIPAAAKALHISPARAYALADAGTLDRLKAGGAVYVSKTSLDFYRAKLRPPTGWLTVQAATERYHYGRSALYKLLGRAKLRRRSIGGRVYLCGRDLDKSLGLTR